MLLIWFGNCSLLKLEKQHAHVLPTLRLPAGKEALVTDWKWTQIAQPAITVLRNWQKVISKCDHCHHARTRLCRLPIFNRFLHSNMDPGDPSWIHRAFEKHIPHKASSLNATNDAAALHKVQVVYCSVAVGVPELSWLRLWSSTEV